MKHTVLLMLIITFLLTGCSGKPSESEIETLFVAEAAKDSSNQIFEIKNFKKTNGIDQDDKTYIVDIAYDLVFKKSAQDLKAELGMMALVPLIVQFGDFKAGDSKHNESKLTLIKSENGWIIKSDR